VLSPSRGLRPDFPIRTPRLDLRPHRRNDLDDLVRFHGDPEVVRYVPWPVRDRPATEEALRKKLDQGQLAEPGQWLVLAVELRETRTVIGEVLLKWESEENRQGEIGFAFARDHQRQGYGREAAEAVLRLGFEDLDLRRITAVCVEENEASAALLRHLGFRQEARHVESTLFKGAWVTDLVFALLRSEWRPSGG
jgi:RimJ/RimL family protein N-acetyltransferase